jgi:hypothetical protein
MAYKLTYSDFQFVISLAETCPKNNRFPASEKWTG